MPTNSFIERWNLPVEPITDVVGNVPNVPTMQPPSNPNLYGLPVEFQKPLIELEDNRLINDYQVSQGVKPLNKLFGLDGERFQTWPEKMVRSGVSLPADVWEGREPILDPETGRTSGKVIERAMDTAGFAGMGGIGMGGAVDASLGSAPYLRPALKHDGKVYKGKVGEEHPVPENLRADFEKKALSGEDITSYNFGFVNHKGHFLTREQALDYAIKEGLVDPHTAQYGTLTTTMLEDSKAGTGIAALANKAKEHFGITKDAREAGYVMPDGSMLDLTGRHYSGGYIKNSDGTWSVGKQGEKDYLRGTRSVDHREINELLGDTGISSGTDNMRKFMNEANAIRNNPGIGFDTTFMPTDKQLNVLVSNHNKNYRGESFQVELTNPNNGDTIATKEFNKPNVETVKKWLSQNIKENATLFEDTRAATGIGAINQSGFYSNLERVIATSKVEKATPEQWISYLKNQPGIKGEELEFSLSGLKGEKPITKAELEAHIAENGVKFGEVWKGDLKFNEKSPYALPEVIKAAKEAGSTPGDLELVLANDGNAYRALTKKFPKLAENENWAEIVSKDVFGGDTMPTGTHKFSGYQLPGGENYRELLLTVPNARANNLAQRMTEIEKELSIPSHEISEVAKRKLREEYANLAVQARQEPTHYQSSHWDEPNVLAHIRMNDRRLPNSDYSVVEGKNGFYNIVDKDGNIQDLGSMSGKFGSKETAENVLKSDKGLKTLHIEEIQSDWHQAGRKQGYKISEAERAKMQKELEEIQAERAKLVASSNITDRNRYAELNQKEAELTDKYNQTVHDAVPNAPFKKSWDELALKRTITEAVKGGYDAVSWTPGEAQAKRYDLSQQIEKIHFEKTDKGYLLGPVDKNGSEIPVNNGLPIPVEKLADYIGKEAADKILTKSEKAGDFKPLSELPKGYEAYQLEGPLNTFATEYKVKSPEGYNVDGYNRFTTPEAAKESALKRINRQLLEKHREENNVLENVDLKIGGEGMKAFYDTMLVSKANNILKKMGGKVEYEHLPFDKKKINRDEVRPDEIAQKAYASEWDKNVQEINMLRKKYDDFRYSEVPKMSQQQADKAIARIEELERINDKIHKNMVDETIERITKEAKGDRIPIIRITPTMREKIAKEGFPLFTAPVYVPVDNNPFEPTLTPIPYDPFKMTPVSHVPEF